MTKEREALKLALEALEVANSCVDGYYIPKGKTQLPEVEEAITAIREALAQPEQEPVAIVSGYYGGQCVILPIDPARIFNSNTALYTTPPQPEQNQFNPDWDAMAVMVEEQQRMAKRIAELEAQPEQEPVATLWQHGETGRTRITMPNDITDCDARWFKAADLYTTPPQQQRCYCGNIYRLGVVHRESSFCDEHPRKPLTDEEIDVLVMDSDGTPNSHLEFARAIEAAHGIKE